MIDTRDNLTIATELLYNNSVNWYKDGFGLNISAGATNYHGVEDGYYWHLDGYLEIDYKYVVNHYLLQENGIYRLEEQELKLYGKDDIGTIISANSLSKDFTGYTYQAELSNPDSIALGGGNNEAFNLYYTPITVEPNNAKIVKVDQDGNPIGGAEFTFAENASTDMGESLKASASNAGILEKAANFLTGSDPVENQFVIAQKLVYGKVYKVTESKTPAGYTGVDPFYVTLSADGKSLVVCDKTGKPVENGSVTISELTITVKNSEKADVTINYVSADEAKGTVTPGSETLAPATGVAKGSTATAKPGYKFVKWTVGNEIVSANATLSKADVDEVAKVTGAYVATTFTAHFAIDNSQTKNLTATVDYKLGEVVQTKDHVDLTATVQVLEPDTLSTAGVSEKAYEGWKLDKITINDEEVDALPATVNNEAKVVYHYVIDGSQTKDLAATVDYVLGDVVQEEDHIDLKDTVQVLEPDTLSTAGVSEKAYEGWKLDKITINDEEVDALPATVNNEAKVVYHYVIDGSQTKDLAATVDYVLGDVVQEEDHIDLKDTVQVLEPDTLSTAGVSEKAYEGWKLDKITIDDEEVDALPATVDDGAKVVYYYVLGTDILYTVNYWYQDPALNPEDEDSYTLKSTDEGRTTTAGAIVYITKTDAQPQQKMYRFNAEKSDIQKQVKADGSTVLNVYFDALYNVEYWYADELTSYKVASSGHVYGFNDKVVAPGMYSVDQFDGKWYKDEAESAEWVFDNEVIGDNILQDPAKVVYDKDTHTIYLYTRAKVTPQNANTLTISKEVRGTEAEANKDYGFNLKLLVKAPVETDPITGAVADALHTVNAAKLQAEGEYRAAAMALEEAEGIFRNNNMFMTTNSHLSFVMYDSAIEDENGDTILPAIYGLTTGSAYGFDFQSYNLYENSFAVIPADNNASVNDGIKDQITAMIKKMAGWTGEEGIMPLSMLAEPVEEPFETLDPETLLSALQEAGVNTSGSALAFGFNEASDMYLAAKDVAEKWKIFQEKNAALESYMENIGRYASVTVNGEKFVLNAKDDNGDPLYAQDENGNYVLSFDFTLRNGGYEDFTVTATTGSSIQFIVTETYDGGADSTTVNDVTTHSAYGFLTAEGNTIAFVNTFEDDGPVDPWDPWEPTDPTDPTDPDIEIEDPDVPLTDPEEPVIEIEDPDVPLVDVPGEEVEIDEPEVPLGDAPQTGDNSNTIPFVVLMLAAACGLVVTRRKLN